MSNLAPLGMFVRDRIDWNIEALWTASLYGPGAASVSPQFSLYNNASDGSYLAVYGILLARTIPNRFGQAFTATGADTAASASQNPTISSIMPLAAAIPGTLGYSTSGAYGLNPAAITFAANGANWLTFNGKPLFILAPNMSCRVQYAQLQAPNPAQYEPSACTFLYGLYTQAKSSIQARQVTAAAAAAANNQG